MDINAFKQTAYVSENAMTAVTYSIINATTGEVVYDSHGDQTGTMVASISSNASETDGYYRFDQGKKKNLTLSASYKPGISGSYRLRLDSIEFNSIPSAPNTTYIATPSSDFRTGNVNIIN